MISLFPPINASIKNVNGKKMIFDPIRKKYLVLTPEEWVRQHLISFLISNFSVPKNRIAQETKLVYENLQSKRTDVLISNDFGQALILIECKRPEVKLDQKVVDQAFRYNKELKVPYVFITNGIEMFGYIIKSNTIEPLVEFPNYSVLSSSLI